jgi:hypothetical protein
MVMNPAEVGTRNDCAGEGQQQFTRHITASMIGWLMDMKQSVEWKCTGETEVLGENPLQCHFLYHRSHLRLLKSFLWLPVLCSGSVAIMGRLQASRLKDKHSVLGRGTRFSLLYSVHTGSTSTGSLFWRSTLFGADVQSSEMTCSLLSCSIIRTLIWCQPLMTETGCASETLGTNSTLTGLIFREPSIGCCRNESLLHNQTSLCFYVIRFIIVYIVHKHAVSIINVVLYISKLITHASSFYVVTINAFWIIYKELVLQSTRDFLHISHLCDWRALDRNLYVCLPSGVLEQWFSNCAPRSRPRCSAIEI